MTNISTAFDTLKSLCSSNFPMGSGYFQLANPYDIEQNTEQALLQGWGIALKQAQNTQRNLSCRLSLQRSIDIILTRRRFALELDIDPKETAEKLILEDQYFLIKAVEMEPALNSAASGIARIAYVSDAGIESVIAGAENYIKLVTTFEMEYFENL